MRYFRGAPRIKQEKAKSEKAGVRLYSPPKVSNRGCGGCGKKDLAEIARASAEITQSESGE